MKDKLAAFRWWLLNPAKSNSGISPQKCVFNSEFQFTFIILANSENRRAAHISSLDNKAGITGATLVLAARKWTFNGLFKTFKCTTTTYAFVAESQNP